MSRRLVLSHAELTAMIEAMERCSANTSSHKSALAKLKRKRDAKGHSDD